MNVHVIDSGSRERVWTGSSVEGAEAFIDGMLKGARISVNNELIAAIEGGVFEIDAPEKLVNPRRR